MDASFEEKSVWIQLLSIVVIFGGYFVVAGMMIRKGVVGLPAFVPLFVVTIVLLVVVNAAGHAVAAVASRPEGRDERDRLIGWRAEANSAWIVATGAICAIMCMILSIENVWIAHLLLLSMCLSETVRCACQLVYYRRGM